MFKAFWRKSGFFVYLKDSSGEMKATLTFDTGAICSVLSIAAITDEPVDKETLIKKLEDRAKQRRFVSASGTQMHGYLVRASNMSLSGYPIDEFYYYLIVDVDEMVALLGNDFISCCSFTHEEKGDIEVNSFDKTIYGQSYHEAIDDSELQLLIGELI